MKIQQDGCSGPTAPFLCTASSNAPTPYIRKQRRRPPITHENSQVIAPLRVATACYIVLYRRLQSRPIEAPTEASLPPPGASQAPTPVRLLRRTSQNSSYPNFPEAQECELRLIGVPRCWVKRHITVHRRLISP